MAKRSSASISAKKTVSRRQILATVPATTAALRGLMRDALMGRAADLKTELSDA